MVLVCMFLTVTCGTYKKNTSWMNIGNDGVMYEVIDDTLNLEEFYKFCERDTLALNLENWVRFEYFDGNQEQMEQWFYIKSTDTNTFYVLTKVTDSTYRLTVRGIK